MINSIKKFIKKYSHAWTAAYIFIYLPWFMWLENTVTPMSDYTNIHIPLDDMIPFCEYFIVPYVLWFAFVPLSLLFLILTSKEEYYKASIYLYGGMSICLLICTLWPNGQDLRIENLDPSKNIFTAIIYNIYQADTNTNVFPSIHCFNSSAVFMTLVHSKQIKGKKRMPILIFCGVLAVCIVLSTFFLKQHSIVDSIGGVALAAIMYPLIYCVNWKSVFAKKKETKLSEV